MTIGTALVTAIVLIVTQQLNEPNNKPEIRHRAQQNKGATNPKSMEVYRPGRSTKARGLMKLLAEVQELIRGRRFEQNKHNNAEKTRYTKCTEQT